MSPMHSCLSMHCGGSRMQSMHVLPGLHLETLHRGGGQKLKIGDLGGKIVARGVP